MLQCVMTFLLALVSSNSPGFWRASRYSFSCTSRPVCVCVCAVRWHHTRYEGGWNGRFLGESSSCVTPRWYIWQNNCHFELNTRILAQSEHIVNAYGLLLTAWTCCASLSMRSWDIARLWSDWIARRWMRLTTVHNRANQNIQNFTKNRHFHGEVNLWHKEK